MANKPEREVRDLADFFRHPNGLFDGQGVMWWSNGWRLGRLLHVYKHRRVPWAKVLHARNLSKREVLSMPLTELRSIK